MDDTQKEAAKILEKQLEAEAPNLPAALRRSLASLGAQIAVKATQAEEAKEKPPATPPQMASWEDGKSGVPNALVRSALFPALHPTQKENRRFLEEERVCSVVGVDVIFTGKQFDQSDLDVYLELLNMARHYPLGTPIKFSAYALLKALGLPTGGSNNARLHSVLTRLMGGTIEIVEHKQRYFGGLIQGGRRDVLTLDYELTINPKFAVFFGFCMWTAPSRAGFVNAAPASPPQ